MTSTLFGDSEQPLADRIRPTDLSDYVGQEHLTANGQLIRSLIESGEVTSLILWGPPGTGKTTLARIIAASASAAFEEISAVSSGIADVKKVIERAKTRRNMGQSTLLFVDEIHRFNKAQQDAFLPHVENGTIALIGATTENPSFEVIGPLLSRSRVVSLRLLSESDLEAIIDRALLHLPSQTLAQDARQLLISLAGGDARVALNGLETAAKLAQGEITKDAVKQALQTTNLRHDKAGDYHYDLISAFIKSMRGGSVDAALFYLARMLEGGEDPKFIARRMVIFASEDIGVAANDKLALAVACFAAVERIGMPECRINLSHTAVALTLSAKSRATYDALNRATEAVRSNPAAEVPLHLRNAATPIMREQGYGQGTKWEAGFVHDEGFMPNSIQDHNYWRSDKE